MPVSLSVSQVRQEIERAVSPDRQSPGIGAEFGRLFHEFVSRVLSDEELAQALITGDEPSDRLLRRHVYENMLGPLLVQQHSAMPGRGAEVLALWDALRACCNWLAELLCEAHRSGLWPGGGAFGLEESLTWTLQEPGWTDSVVLSGVADAVLRLPDARGWCVLEFKTSPASEEADLAQACLYHAMLGATHETAGSLSLVRFFDGRKREFHFRGAQLAPALPKLKALIGRLAGVADAHGTPRTAGPTYPELGARLLETLREFRCPASLAGDPVTGPAFLRFYLTPARGIKPKAIAAAGEALQVRLNLIEPPLIRISDGRLAVDLQRPDRQTLNFSDIRPCLPRLDPERGSSKLVVGVDLAGRIEFADLANAAHAHLLVAGTTGSGKSEWLRTALASLLLANTPETLRLVLIDPKRSAFNDLAGSPFLHQPLVFPDETGAAEVFADLAEEMDIRYRHLQDFGCDSLGDLVARGKPLPRIVCVCDEYFDLVQRGRNERKAIEQSLFRLGAKARAAGIHLILATQQASREVIRGPLDTNMPARVALKTSKAIESQMLLGEKGAERLLGAGDLLFRDIGTPRRLQAPFLPADERAAIFGGSAHG